MPLVVNPRIRPRLDKHGSIPLSVPVDGPFLATSRICAPCRVSLTVHDTVEVHACCNVCLRVVPFYCRTICGFIHFPVDGRLGCFRFFGSEKNAAVNTCVQRIVVPMF